MNANSALLSVIVPVYNTRDYIEHCLSSLKEQTLYDIEVIIVNDGSTDGSDVVIKQFVGGDSRFMCLCQTNCGPSASRNAGLKIAKGKYIAFVDSDDWIRDPDSLKILYSAAERNNADIVMGNVLSVYPDGTSKCWSDIQKELFKEGEVLSGETFFRTMVMNGCYVPMVYDYIYKRAYLSKHNFVFQERIIHEDELWVAQVLLPAERMTYSNNVHYCYRRREGSIMTSSSNNFRIRSLSVVVGELLSQIDKYVEKDKDTLTALCLNLLRLYQTALNICGLDDEDEALIYDKAGHIIAVCKYLQSRGIKNVSYQPILDMMRKHYNKLQCCCVTNNK